MKFRLVEEFQLDGGAYRACITAIKSGLDSFNKSTRGNGVTVSILSSLYEYITGVKINCNDYILHHVNGKHDDNRIDNVVLFKKTLSHTAFHADIIKKVAFTFAQKQHAKSGSKITSKLFDECTPQQIEELTHTFMNICCKKTFRSKNTDEIIYLPDYISKCA